MDSIVTSRFLLRPFKPEDVSDIHAVMGDDPDMTWERKPWPLELTEKRLMLRIKHYKEHGFGVWAVIDKATGEMVGQTGLQILEGTNDIELVSFTAKRWWRKGVSFETCTAALMYGFQELNLPKIIAVIRPDNTAAQQLANKLGFQFVSEGIAYGIDVFYYELPHSEFALDCNQCRVCHDE